MGIICLSHYPDIWDPHVLDDTLDFMFKYCDKNYLFFASELCEWGKIRGRMHVDYMKDFITCIKSALIIAPKTFHYEKLESLLKVIEKSYTNNQPLCFI